MSETKKRIDWTNHIVGFVSVVLGVVMAFWLNSWNEQRKETRSVRVALQNIKREILKNQANLDTIVDQNRRHLVFLEELLGSTNNEMEVTVSAEKWQGLVEKYPEELGTGASGVRLNLSLYQLSEVAWATAHRTAVLSSIDFDLAFTLEEVYDLQEKLNEFDQSFIVDLRAISGDKRTFARILQSVTMSIDLAKSLREKEYPKALAAIDQFLEK